MQSTNIAAGTQWNYRFISANVVQVNNLSKGNEFTLNRCPTTSTDPASTQTNAAQTTNLATIGPSFDCQKAHDIVATAICADATLRRADLELNQSYQALRQQLPENQKQLLRLEAIAFVQSLTKHCQLPLGGPRSVEGIHSTTLCLLQDFQGKRQQYLSRLSAEGLQEARRDLAQQIALQVRLASLGLLNTADPLIGVYGPLTRAAISRFQSSRGMQPNGLMTDVVAAALLSTETPTLTVQAVQDATTSPRQPEANTRPSMGQSNHEWDDFFSGKTSGLGVFEGPSPNAYFCSTNSHKSLFSLGISQLGNRALIPGAINYKVDYFWFDNLENLFKDIDNCKWMLFDRAEFRQILPAMQRDGKKHSLAFVIDSDVIDRAVAAQRLREEVAAAQQRREQQERETEKAAVTAQRQVEAMAKAEAEQSARAAAELEAKQQTRKQEEMEAGRQSRVEKLAATGVSLVDGYEFYTEMRSNSLRSSLKYTGKKIQVTGLMATGINVLGGQAVLTLEDHIICKIEGRDDQLTAAEAKRLPTTIEGTVESISSGTAIIGRCRMICQFRDCPQ